MYVAFSASIPKHDQYASENEDVLSIDETRLALSDGASESFDSKSWASILASRFVVDPRITDAWIEEAVVEYELRFARETLSWSKMAAYERGSFATLLGIEFSGADELSIFGMGDSIAVVVDGTELGDAFPYR